MRLANGIVLEQSVAEGTKLKKGDTITITINEISEEPEEPENTVDPGNTVDPEINDVIENPNDIVDTNTTL